MATKTKKPNQGTDVPRPNLGEFTIDPTTEEFSKLRDVCEPGNPWRCLVATMGSIAIGKRMTVRLDHASEAGTIGVTEGDYRYERPLTTEEAAFAVKFDFGTRMRKPLTVKVDLADLAWEAKRKKVGGGKDRQRPDGTKTRNAHPKTKSLRARALAAIKEARERLQGTLRE